MDTPGKGIIDRERDRCGCCSSPLRAPPVSRALFRKPRQRIFCLAELLNAGQYFPLSSAYFPRFSFMLFSGALFTPKGRVDEGPDILFTTKGTENEVPCVNLLSKRTYSIPLFSHFSFLVFWRSIYYQRTRKRRTWYSVWCGRERQRRISCWGVGEGFHVLFATRRNSIDF